MTTTRPGNEQATVTVTYPSPSEIRVERSFDAPRRLVWDAHTKPELIKQWQLGPDGWTMPNCRFDAREGGSYRFEWLREATGERMAMGGSILEYSPVERMVSTEQFDEAWYPGECVNTHLFEELDGGTRMHLSVTSRFESEAALKQAVETGMLEGVELGYDLLAGLLRTLVEELR